MNELIEYVRVKRGPRKGNLRGVVLATKDGVGWSFTRTTIQKGENDTLIPPDRFDKEKGLMIARGRAKHSTMAQVPRDVAPVFDRMLERQSRYFGGNREPVAV